MNIEHIIKQSNIKHEIYELDDLIYTKLILTKTGLGAQIHYIFIGDIISNREDDCSGKLYIITYIKDSPILSIMFADDGSVYKTNRYSITNTGIKPIFDQSSFIRFKIKKEAIDYFSICDICNTEKRKFSFRNV